MRDNTDAVAFALLLPFALAALLGSCAMKGWRYDECIKVGHSETYCEAEWLGCMGRGR